MNFVLTRIHPRKRGGTSPAEALLETYAARIAHGGGCELRDFPSEATFAEFLDKAVRRTRPALILADSRGLQLTSEDFAGRLKRLADSGTQDAMLAVGPPDGWSTDLLARADFTLAFGRITLPHELAMVILAEQVYRATTIWSGHPYHGDH